jgi:hypothetical protein
MVEETNRNEQETKVQNRNYFPEYTDLFHALGMNVLPSFCP